MNPTRRELYVTCWGHGTSRQGDPYPIVQHPFDYNFAWSQGRVLSDLAIIFLKSGAGEYEDQSLGRLRWNAGEVLILPAGIWHRYRPDPDTGWTEFWFCVNGEYIHRLRAKGLLPHTPLLRKLRGTTDFLSTIKRVCRKAKVNSLLVEAHAMEVLAMALEGVELSHRGFEPTTTGYPLIDRSLEFIWLNSHRPLTARSVAAQLGTTRRTLERAFAEVHSRAIAEEITFCRLQRAKLLLGESRMTVKEIGHATGFGGSKRLIRTFRRELKQTPIQFRRKSQSTSSC